MEMLLTSMWLGILTSISPCPLTTNIAAISFIEQRIKKTSYVLISSILYTLGRTFLYTALGFVLSLGVGSLPSVSHFFQTNMYFAFAVILIFIGLILVDLIKIPFNFSFFKNKSEKFKKITFLNSFIIGVLFASAFCPVSGALFFGNLIQSEASILSLALYGVGTGLPVLIIALVISFSLHSIEAMHKYIAKFEKYSRKITGIIFIFAGVYSLIKVLGISGNILEIFTHLADYFAYSLFGLSPEEHLGKAVHFFIEDTTKIFTLLFFITTIVSFFRSHLKPEKVREYLEGKPKWLSYILAVVLGAITPFCSCSSIPLFIGFVEAGIPFGVTMAFLITSPMINEIAIVVFAGVVGWELSAVYVLTGMTVGLIGGILMEKLGFEKYIESYVYDIRIGKTTIEEKVSTFKGHLKYALDYALDIIKKVWLYVLIGIGIGAFLHGYVPEEFFVKYTGKENIFAVPLAVIMGIPLYSNATGVIPIAEALLSKGVPVGTVLAMMMSVVAISLPEMIILKKVLKVRFLLYFALYLLLSFIFVGYLYNFIF